jgi:hypothetical protein
MIDAVIRKQSTEAPSIEIDKDKVFIEAAIRQRPPLIGIYEVHTPLIKCVNLYNIVGRKNRDVD